MSESVLTGKQRPPFGSGGQAGTKLSGRLLDMSPLFTPRPVAPAEEAAQSNALVFRLRAVHCVFQVCTGSTLEMLCSCAGGVCIPRASSKKFPLETPASPGTDSPRDVTCLVSLGRNTPCFIVSMHKKLAKCMASSMIRFLFHRATVIYGAYFHVVTRKCFHLMIGQCTFLYQTCLKTFYCFKNIFSQAFFCFNQICS